MDTSHAASARGWSGQNRREQGHGGARPDPYLAWAEATDFDDLGGKPVGWVRVIIELEARTLDDGARLTAKEFAERLENENRAWQNWIRVSSLYRYPPPGLEETRFLTALITSRFFEELHGSLKGYVSRFQLGLPVVPDDVRPGPERAKAGPEHGNRPDFVPRHAPLAHRVLHPEKRPVFMGVIDDGLAFAHERFRHRDDPPSTRIDDFWNQDDPPGAPVSVHYGIEFSKDGIDALMTRCRRNELIDEDAVYALAGYLGVRKRWAHGTEVMDIACGERPIDRARSRGGSIESLHVIAVQFRTAGRTIRDTSGLWFSVYALDALRYIARRAADRADGEHSVVINLSYGYIAGPHDGSSMIEAAMDELISLHPDLRIVVPAGNSNLDRCHAQLEVKRAEGRCREEGRADERREHEHEHEEDEHEEDEHEAFKPELYWRVLPDCATPSFLEIWLPPGKDVSKFGVRVLTPWGVESPPIARDSVYVWKPGRHVLCTVVWLNRVATGKRDMILVALAPTLTRNAHRDPAPSGMWKIMLENGTDADLQINAWVQRNETAYGFPLRGRQSRFEDWRYVRFDRWGQDKDFDDPREKSWVRRDWTLSSVATGAKTIVIGGYRRSDGTAALYSATGPASPPPEYDGKPVRAGPDAVTPSDDSVECAGLLAASTRSGSLAAITGTSAAAPRVARWLACLRLAPPGGSDADRSLLAERAIERTPAFVAAQAHCLEAARGRPPGEPRCERSSTPPLPPKRGGSGRIPLPWKTRGIDP